MLKSTKRLAFEMEILLIRTEEQGYSAQDGANFAPTGRHSPSRHNRNTILKSPERKRVHKHERAEMGHKTQNILQYKTTL